MNQNRNLFIAMSLSVLILVVWQVFYLNPQVERERVAREAALLAERAGTENRDGDLPAGNAASPSGDLPRADPGVNVLPGAGAPNREAALGGTRRIAIDTPTLTGSINLTGARLDDLQLKRYRETVDPESPIIELLSPAGAATGYFAEFGYLGDEAGALPGPDTVWTVEGEPVLTPQAPVTLVWSNNRDLVFRRTLSIDANYLFTITDTVTNTAAAAASLQPYGRVTRLYKPNITDIFVLHEGFVGVIGEEGLQEFDYEDVEEAQTVRLAEASGGWLGITDKYWATVLVPRQDRPFTARFSYFGDGRARYQTDFVTGPLTVEPGGTLEVEQRLFAGAKRVVIVDDYEQTFGIDRFDRMIDWGWFYFITKPMFYVLDALYRLFGNFGVAILATTVLLKLLFFPLANKSYKSMANMKKVQPQLEEIKARFGDDRQGMQKAMMELYRREKINPVAGCWPVLLQIPVFFALYKVLFVTIEMRHAAFFGWIRDLSAPDPTSIFNLFGLIPLDLPLFLNIGVWPLLMGITMFLQMRMNPTPPDPTQAMIFNWMPVVFTFMLATFPAGLVIYWAWNNFLSIIQQGVIMKRQGVKIELWDNLAGLIRGKPKAAE